MPGDSPTLSPWGAQRGGVLPQPPRAPAAWCGGDAVPPCMAGASPTPCCAGCRGCSLSIRHTALSPSPHLPPAPPAPRGARAPLGQPSTHPGCQHRADTGQAAAWGRGAGSCWPPAALLPPSTACCRFYGAARWDAPGGGPRCPAQPQPPRTQGPEASPAPFPPPAPLCHSGAKPPMPTPSRFWGAQSTHGTAPTCHKPALPGPRMKPGPPAGAAPHPASLHRGAGPQPGRARLCWRRQIVPQGGSPGGHPAPHAVAEKGCLDMGWVRTWGGH